MFLTAQRVESPSTGATGINAYAYAHNSDWTAPSASILQILPGELLRETVAVKGPGNRVRSYIDIAVPSSATTDELSEALTAFLTTHGDESFPWEGVENRCAFRLGMDQSLASAWRAEVAELLGAIAGTLKADMT